MKKLLIIFIFLYASCQAFASDSNFFDFNEESINLEMKHLSELEEFVLENPDITPEQLFAGMGTLPANIQIACEQTNFHSMGGPVEFLYLGCGFGASGVILGAIGMAQDADELTVVGLGCLVPTGIFSLGIYFDDPFLIEIAINWFIEFFLEW